METRFFWAGVAVLVVGVMLFAWGYSTVQNIRELAASTLLGLDLFLSRHSEAKLQWDRAQILQPIGLGMIVLGACLLAYSVLKKT